MNTEGKADKGGFDPEEDEALWNLLGQHASPVKVSPYFARRVLREIALEEQGGGGWVQRLRRLWVFAPRHTAVWSGAFACGVLCLLAVLTRPGNHPTVAPAAAQAAVDPAEASAPIDASAAAGQESDRVADASSVQDEEVIADLDNLLSREESRLWTEDTDTARF